MSTTRRGLWRFGALLAGLGIIISILAVTAVVGDLQKLRDLWQTLYWQNLVYIVMLALVDHGLRYWRWELLLRRVAARSFRRWVAFLIFSAGSLLIFTPGRVGEAAKSVYARDFFAIPIATSLPVIIAERLSDVVVMALLASLGLLLLGETVNVVLALIILAGILAVVVLRRPLLQWVSSRLGRSGSGLGQAFSLASDSQLSLVTPSALGINVTLGTGAWMTEVLIYFLSLWALGVPVSSYLFVLALAVFPLGSLAGSLSFLPGGLGATEGGITALGILLSDLSQEVVVLSALIARAAILGVVVIVGILSLLVLHRVPVAPAAER